jgi:large subunit ribosomal protein L24
MSTQPRKERKTLYNLPVHLRRARMACHLDEPLLLKYNKRNLTVRKGDTVRIMRGEFAGITGKVLDVITRTGKVTVDGVSVSKAKATQVARPLDPSNLVITKLDLTDPKRREALGAADPDATPSGSGSRSRGKTPKEASE